jgi:hypothetical protein
VVAGSMILQVCAWRMQGYVSGSRWYDLTLQEQRSVGTERCTEDNIQSQVIVLNIFLLLFYLVQTKSGPKVQYLTSSLGLSVKNRPTSVTQSQMN